MAEKEMIQGRNNYEDLCEAWRLKFLEMNQEELCRRLPGLAREGDYLTLVYFGRKFGVHTASGQIVVFGDDRPISVNTRMNIYNLFWYSREGARIAGRWVPFRDVKNASPFAPAFDRNVLRPFARTFSGKAQPLLAAARALNGQMVKQGDVGFIVDSFACIPMQFLFWDGDEEFPAQANILFDCAVTDFIHVESTVTLATDGLRRLAEEAGVPLLGSTFEM